MKDLLLNFFTKIVFAISVFAISVLSARYFGPSDRGDLALYLNLFNMLSILFGFSLADAIFHPTILENENFSVSFVSSTALAQFPVILTILVFYILSIDVSLWVALVIALAVVSQIVDGVVRAVATREGHLSLHNYFSVLGKVVTLGIVAYVCYFGLEITLILGAISFGLILPNLIYYILYSKSDRPTFDIIKVVKFYKVAITIHTGLIGTVLLSQGDQFIVGRFLSREQIAFYQIAVQFISLVLIIPQAAVGILYYKISQLSSDQVSKIAVRVMYLGLLYSAISVIAMQGLSKGLLLKLFGDNYISSYSYIVNLSYIIFGTVSMTLMSVFWIRLGLNKINSVLSLSIGCLFVIATWMTIKEYEISAVTWASVVAYSLIALFNGIFWSVNYLKRRRIWT